MEITSMIMENHGKIMELCFWISVGTLIYDTFQKVNNKCTDQTAWIIMLVCTCVTWVALAKAGLRVGQFHLYVPPQLSIII